MALTRHHTLLSFDLFGCRERLWVFGEHIRALSELGIFPPTSWRHQLYAHLIDPALLARKDGRKSCALDSFAGVPPLEPEYDNLVFQEHDYSAADYGPETQWLGRICVKSTELGLDDTLTIMPGFFDDTLPNLPEEAKFSFVHVDCDFYPCLYEVLNALYDRVVDGGCIVIDDYLHPAQGPLRTVASFFNARGLFPLYHVSFRYTVFVRKGDEADPETSHFSADGNICGFEHLRADETLIKATEASLPCAQNAEGGAGPAANAALFLSLLQNRPKGRVSEIYHYRYALRDVWNGFQDHRTKRDTFRILIAVTQRGGQTRGALRC